MRELKARIDDGRLGTIAHCYAEQNSPAGLFMDPASWRAEASEAPAGGMTAMGVHNLDAMIHLFGGSTRSMRRASPRDRLRRRGHDQRDVRFRQRHVGSLLCSLVTAVSYRLAVFGSKGCAELVTPNSISASARPRSAMPTGRHTRPSRRSSRTAASTRCSPSWKRLRRRSAARRPTRSRRGDPARRRGVRGDRPIRRDPSAGQGRARLRIRPEGIANARHRFYPEARQQPGRARTRVFGPDVRIVKRDTGALSELSDADCAEADGLMIMGFPVTGADLERFPRLRAIVRMGVGYDKLDRPPRRRATS
jgi:hypothetical protein